MRIKHIKSSELNTNRWSGGSTTQLAIYPEDAEYIKQNFLFRISTATVEAEESTFTLLPGVSRKLMILDGEIKIEHKDHHSMILKKFDQDEFSGSCETKSYGKAIDFNVMTTGNTYGEIEAIALQKDKKHSLELLQNIDFLVLYVYTGRIKVILEEKSTLIEKGDVLIIEPKESFWSLFLESILASEIIVTRISIKK